MRKRFQPIYVPLALSGLAVALYVASLVAAFFLLVGFPIELHGWGGDIWYVIGFVLLLMGAVYTLPLFLLALGLIWGVYWLVMAVRRRRKTHPRKRRVNGRTPEEELWFDES